MIVKISGSGKSFKGLSAYLTHDPNARTDERVAWTHTLNLANDHVPSAVNEMYLTAENAELLKQQAGVRAGGRSMESPVKHISLNWAPDEKPTREHMIETSEKFLEHMKWREHQAILISHYDKSYSHVHLMLNAVHPETGLRLNESFEQRRAQAWALEYEREQNRIYCEQRLKAERDREANMPRNIWMEFKVNEYDFSRAEGILAENAPEIPENPKNAQWKILKEFQRAERTEYFAQGKAEFSEVRNIVFREVRDDFRPRWGEYYEAKRNGLDQDALASMKAQLVADQRAVLEPRRNAAFDEFRQQRDGRYDELLEHQREVRQEFRWQQDAGLDVTLYLNELADRKKTADIERLGFHAAGGELAGRQYAGMEARERGDGITRTVSGVDEDVRFDPVDRIGGGFLSFGGALFSDLINLGSARPVPMSAEEKKDIFREAAENATKQQQRGREEEEESSRRHKEYYRE